MEERIILGLDISTSSTGIAIVQGEELLYNKSVVVKTPSTKHINEIAYQIKEELECVLKDHQVTDVYVEESAKGFSGGQTNSNTMIRLSSLNHVCCFMIEEMTGIRPIHIMPATARKLMNFSVPRSFKGKDTKKFLLAKVVETEPTFVYELTRQGNPSPESFDRVDAIIIARSGQCLLRQEK